MISKSKILLIIALTLSMFIFCGCGEKNAETIVREGYLDFDKTTTIGQAFDGYAYFKNKTWKEYQSENGTEMVQFVGNYDLSTGKFTDHLMSMQKMAGASNSGSESEMKIQEDVMKSKINEKFKSVDLILDFAIQSDDSIEIHSMKLKTDFEGNQTEKNIEETGHQHMLHEIYNNQPSLYLGVMFGIVLEALEAVDAKQNSLIAECQENLAKIDGAKEQWALEFKHSNGTEIDTEEFLNNPDIIGPNGYLWEKPICPSGGTYTVNPIGTDPECSVEEHVFPY